jgi:hypothetical protein
MENLFEEDDQASLLELLLQNPKTRKLMQDEKSPDGKPLMSYSFEIIDFSKDDIQSR